VGQSQSVQDPLSSRGQPNPHLALIVRPRTSRYGTCCLKPIHELDRAVMLNEQPGCQLANRWLDTRRQPLHCEQQLMLLRLDTEALCGCLAEVKELPDLPPEFGEVPVLLQS
jgi:hypothetical protein